MLRVIEGDGRPDKPHRRSLVLMRPDGSGERVTRLPGGFHTEAVGRAKLSTRKARAATLALLQPEPVDVSAPVPRAGARPQVVVFDGRAIIKIGGASSVGLDRQGCCDLAAKLVMVSTCVVGELRNV